MIPRCKDNCWRDKFSADWYVPWCPHSRPLRYEDIKNKVPDKYWDGRAINWLRFCTKTGKVVVHNKKCDVAEIVSAYGSKSQ